MEIRNVTIAGHGGAGKTTLFEHILFAAGAIAKPEDAGFGKTVSSASAEEVAHKISIYTTLANFQYNGVKINLFDTPGSSDFSGDVILSFRASEFAMMACDGRAGVQIETIKLWRNLDERKKPRGVFVTKLDGERVSFERVLGDIKDKFKTEAVPLSIPMGEGGAFKGVIDVLKEVAYIAGSGNEAEKEAPIPAEYKEAAINARLRVMEAAADGDEILMEKYILLGALEPEDVYKGLNEALSAGLYVPVFAVSAQKNSGLTPFLNFMANIAPSPYTSSDFAGLKDGGKEEVPCSKETPLRALVIKTVYDQFSGKLSWVKVVSGVLHSDSDIFNVCENKKERVGKLYVAAGKKLSEVKELEAGDIGIITKSATLKTNDTIALQAGVPHFVPLRLPEPVHFLAVNALTKKDDVKLGEFLSRAAEEDKTFRYEFNSETKETVISGMGELHINIILDKARNNQKIEVETRIPRVAYRETITKGAQAEYTHKKQTGGHGQYGKVLLEIKPLPRGENYNFVNAIFGGAVPKNYIPGVEKGILEGMSHGVLAGYPVVDVEAKLTDGKYHPVDSSELSFKLAARNAFREAMKLAAPVLLEPVMNLTVFVEEKYLGDVMSDLSGKRGKILGQEPVGGGIEEIRAQAPHGELLRYSIDLRSITSGTGSFSLEFDHYAPITGRIADDVIKAAAEFKHEESDE
ncbi:MAG: elongation factor G [Spirochaetaceae bacterium]|jgi:elongation factor G|nr:elongation factor G [Spirochaetaceae bacterium]GMO26844.1 MAG: elongation factor G [Termitinemataceae bacterium]